MNDLCALEVEAIVCAAVAVLGAIVTSCHTTVATSSTTAVAVSLVFALLAAFFVPAPATTLLRPARQPILGFLRAGVAKLEHSERAAQALASHSDE
jgi:hypothetical protein